MRFEEALNVVMVTDHVEVEQSLVGSKDQAHGKTEPTFVESPPEGAGAGSAMRVRIAEGLAHRLD